MPTQVHSWCHNLSVNEAAVVSRSLATIYHVLTTWDSMTYIPLSL